MKRLKIAYITNSDPKNKHSWSGTVHYLWKTLEKNVGDVDILGPQDPKLLLFICKAFNFLSVKIINKRYDYRNAAPIAKAYAKIFAKKIQNKKYDLIVSPAGIALTAYLKTNIPIILVLDRCIGGAIDYHTILSNLWEFSRKQSIETDTKAIQQSALTIFSSDWAARHALEAYKIHPSKIMTLPLGANLDSSPDRNTIFKNKKYGRQLLFIGTNWEHKGADIAIHALNTVLKQFPDAHLTLVGSTPPSPIKSDHITIIPFIDKNSEEGKKQLETLFLSSDIFILPTRFEAFGIVFCEASAFGIPSLASNTGGIPTVIKNNINGYLINHEDTGNAYAAKIIELFNNPVKLKELSLSSRTLFEEELNWDAWANKLKSTELLKRVYKSTI